MMTEQEFNALGTQQRRVLEFVWENGSATVQEVLDRINAESQTNLAYTTVLASMQRLEKLGWLYHEKSANQKQVYVYKATRSRKKAIGSALKAFADNFLSGDKPLLFQHFIEDAGLTEEEFDEIRNLIQKHGRTKS
ncbi:MAG: BlaI/MecI/CopY family transcriptional regulator [Thermoguttaceae bacterium]